MFNPTVVAPTSITLRNASRLERELSINIGGKHLVFALNDHQIRILAVQFVHALSDMLEPS